MAKFTIRQFKDYSVEANSIEDALNILIDGVYDINEDDDQTILTTEKTHYVDKRNVGDGWYCFIDLSNGKAICYDD